MDIFELLRVNLLSPPVLAFVLGLLAILLHSDLKLPEELYTVLSIYLLFALGLKGGAALAATPISQVLAPVGMTLLLGCSIPFFVFRLAQLFRFAIADAAALAAHFGSVSAVTFTAATSAIIATGRPVAEFMPALVALLEVPGILIAILLAYRHQHQHQHQHQHSKENSSSTRRASTMTLVHELLTGRSLFMLAGGIIIGILSGQVGLKRVEAFFVDPFQGVLTLFLLEMGLVTGRRLTDLRTLGPRLIIFALVTPAILGSLGVIAGHLAGLDVGSSAVFGAMVGSASYIAAPSAVRIALPQANPAIYLGASLGVAFPFNLSLGIPLYVTLAQILGGS